MYSGNNFFCLIQECSLFVYFRKKNFVKKVSIDWLFDQCTQPHHSIALNCTACNVLCCTLCNVLVLYCLYCSTLVYVHLLLSSSFSHHLSPHIQHSAHCLHTIARKKKCILYAQVDVCSISNHIFLSFVPYALTFLLVN